MAWHRELDRMGASLNRLVGRYFWLNNLPSQHTLPLLTYAYHQGTKGSRMMEDAGRRRRRRRPRALTPLLASVAAVLLSSLVRSAEAFLVSVAPAAAASKRQHQQGQQLLVLQATRDKRSSRSSGNSDGRHPDRPSTRGDSLGRQILLLGGLAAGSLALPLTPAAAAGRVKGAAELDAGKHEASGSWPRDRAFFLFTTL